MNQSNLSLTVETPVDSQAAEQSRRRFMKLLAAGATSFAVQACGGGGGGGTATASLPIGPVPSPSQPATPPSPPPPPAATGPVWVNVPDLTFTQGVAATIPVGQYVSDASAKLLALSLAGTLPAGVTFDAVNKAFVYDGVGAPAKATGLVLTATEG